MLVTVIEKKEGKALVLTATDYYDQETLKEVIEIERYAEVKRDPHTKEIIEISLTLVSNKNRKEVWEWHS